MAVFSCLRVCYLLLILLTCVITIAVISRLSLEPLKVKINTQLSKTFYNQRGRYNSEASNGPDVIVRSVYVDKRHRYGHQNACVFLIEVRKHFLYVSAGLITGCVVGGRVTDDINIRPIYINGKTGKLIDEKPYLTHAMALVECFDLPVTNGSRASLLYRAHREGFIIPAESERPVLIPYEHSSSSGYKIVACMAVAYGQPRYLLHWLRYQKAIGIEHVHIIAENNFNDFDKPYIKAALSSGFLTIDVWKVWLKSNREIQYHSQMLAYHDCLYRFQGTYDYMMMANQDDFFVPLQPNRTSLHWYIKQWCPSGACVFDWIEYYPDCGLKNSVGVPPGNLTSLLVSKSRKWLPYKKSLYRLSDTIEVAIHDPRVMMPHTGGKSVPGSQAYVAHLRAHRQPPNKC